MPDEASERNAFQVPYALAMLICDAVHFDPMTCTPTILGCFTSIDAPEFPASEASMSVYDEVTDGRGRVPVTLRVVDEDDTPLAVRETELDLTDPLVVARLVFTIKSMTFPEPGEYRFQLLSGYEPLLERRILVMQN